MIVGVTGLAQHGKDTVGQRLVEKWGFTRFAFADKLKDLALAINPMVVGNGLPGVVEPGDDGYLYSHLADIVRAYGWEQAKMLPEVRRILQDLGTGARAILGRSVWVDALLEELEQLADDSRCVITDVRFHNESFDIPIIGVERPDFDNGVGLAHDSERHVPALVAGADYRIYNDGTLEQLKREVDIVAARLLGLDRG